MSPTQTSLAPRLIVENVDEAIAFYKATLDAELIERYALANGIVVHAALKIGLSTFSLAQRVDNWQLLSPDAIGGSAVLLRLEVDTPDAIASRMIERGAGMIIEIKDRPQGPPCGKREGRLRDPFGHLWLLTTTIEDLTPAEIERRLSS
jgi:PhnB protein